MGTFQTGFCHERGAVRGEQDPCRSLTRKSNNCGVNLYVNHINYHCSSDISGHHARVNRQPVTCLENVVGEIRRQAGVLLALQDTHPDEQMRSMLRSNGRRYCPLQLVLHLQALWVDEGADSSLPLHDQQQTPAASDQTTRISLKAFGKSPERSGGVSNGGQSKRLVDSRPSARDEEEQQGAAAIMTDLRCCACCLVQEHTCHDQVWNKSYYLLL